MVEAAEPDCWRQRLVVDSVVDSLVGDSKRYHHDVVSSSIAVVRNSKRRILGQSLDHWHHEHDFDRSPC